MNVALPNSVSGSWTQACAWPNGDQDGGRGPGRQNVETESDWVRMNGQIHHQDVRIGIGDAGTLGNRPHSDV